MNLKTIKREDLYTLAITEKNGWRAGSGKYCPNRHSHGKMMIHPLGALGCSTCMQFELTSPDEQASQFNPLASHIHATATRILNA